MARFKMYIESGAGAGLAQTSEFLPYYALPFVSDPKTHPSFESLFATNWVSSIQERLEHIFLGSSSQGTSVVYFFSVFMFKFLCLMYHHTIQTAIVLAKLYYAGTGGVTLKQIWEQQSNTHVHNSGSQETMTALRDELGIVHDQLIACEEREMYENAMSCC